MHERLAYLTAERSDILRPFAHVDNRGASVIQQLAKRHVVCMKKTPRTVRVYDKKR